MKASVLIPAFNAESFIRETLVSCINQGFDFIHEVIVVDDHSTDGTVEVVDQCIREFQEVRILLSTNPSKGACSARNHAFSISSGEAIQWLDADDILGESKLKNQLALLQANPGHLIASKWQRFTGTLENLWPEEKGSWAKVPEKSSPKEWLIAERMMIPAGWLGHRDLFERINPWDERLKINQDGEYFTRALVASNGVIFESKSLVYYRSQLENSTSKFSAEKAESLYMAAESFERTVRRLGDSPDLLQLIANQYQGFIFRSYPYGKSFRKKAELKLKNLPASKRRNDIAESTIAKLFCSIFGWKLLVQLRRLRS